MLGHGFTKCGHFALLSCQQTGNHARSTPQFQNAFTAAHQVGYFGSGRVGVNGICVSLVPVGHDLQTPHIQTCRQQCRFVKTCFDVDKASTRNHLG